MTIETMTIHKGLSELKILDKKIKILIEENTYVGVCLKGEETIDGIQKQRFEDNSKAHLDKLKSLIKRRNAIRVAINHSNAVTNVKVNEMVLTVAQAIAMKAHEMEDYRKLLETMSSQLAQAQIEVVKKNCGLEERATNQLKAVYGSSSPTSSEDVKLIKDRFIDRNTAILVDPIDIKKQIDDLMTFIDNFQSEIDSVISTSNAITTISVEY